MIAGILWIDSKNHRQQIRDTFVCLYCKTDAEGETPIEIQDETNGDGTRRTRPASFATPIPVEPAIEPGPRRASKRSRRPPARYRKTPTTQVTTISVQAKTPTVPWTAAVAIVRPQIIQTQGT